MGEFEISEQRKTRRLIKGALEDLEADSKLDFNFSVQSAKKKLRAALGSEDQGPTVRQPGRRP